MHNIPWYIALIISVPQTVLIIEFGFRLFNIHLKTKDVLLLAAIIAGICYILRALDTPYFVDTLILIASLSLLSSLISRIELKLCFISVVLGVIIYGVLESALLPLIMDFFHISMEEIIANPWINIAAFVPILIILVLLLALAIKKDFVLYDFGSNKNEA